MKEKHLINKLKNSKKIVIYGAGMVGELVYKRLCSNNLLSNLQCFAVTNLGQDKAYLGLPVCEISDIAPMKDTITVIIATLPELHTEILTILQSYKFENIIKVDEELFSDLSKHYIKDFQKEKKIKECQKKILFMSSDNNISSGAFLSMVNLNVELNKRGISTLVVLPAYGNGEKKLLENKVDYTYIQSEHWCVETCYGNYLRKVMLLLENCSAVKAIRKLIKSYGIEIVHCNTTYTYVGAVAGRKEKTPVIWHIRENLKEQGMRFIHSEKCLKVLNESSKIIVISRFIGECVKDLNKSIEKIIYNGIDCDIFFKKREILLDRDNVVITLVGAIAEHKGQEELVEAAHILKRKGFENFTIRIIGKANPQYLLYLKKNVQKYGLEKKVLFFDRKKNIEDFYHSSDIVAVCSVAEPFGRVTIEGQVSGCLVIGANSGATPELIEDGKTGMLYEQGNSENLANCIIKAIEYPEITKQIAKNGQKYAYQKYSKENNASEVIKIYEEILGRKLV